MTARNSENPAKTLTSDIGTPTVGQKAVSYKPVGAVLHAIRLMQVLSNSAQPLGTTAAARGAKVNPSTAFHILRTLAEEGLLFFDPSSKTYRPGVGLLGLSRSLLGRNQADLIRPELLRIATNADCLMALWQVVDDRLVLVDRALADTSVRLDIQVTQRMPSFLGAVGRLVAAYSGLGEEAMRQRFSALRWQNPMSFETYMSEISDARQRGYAVDQERLYRGISAVAGIILDRDERPVMGVSGIVIAGTKTNAQLHELGSVIAGLCRGASGIA